jgi:hypothetical protein
MPSAVGNVVVGAREHSGGWFSVAWSHYQMEEAMIGALAGWRRHETPHGIVLNLQIAASAEKVAARDFMPVAVALNDRQLRSLARDLTRAAASRGIDLWPRQSLWKTLIGRTAAKRGHGGGKR